MSVEQLKFNGENVFGSTDMEVSMELNKFKIELVSIDAYMHYEMDRNQAHLLKLWLEEHLKIDDKELEKANELVYQAWKDKIKLW